MQVPFLGRMNFAAIKIVNQEVLDGKAGETVELFLGPLQYHC